MAAGLLAVALTAVTPAHAQFVVTFDDLPLTGADSYYNGSDESGGFSDQGVHFNNAYDAKYDSWSGFAYSNVDDTTTPGRENEYAAFSGTDRSGAGNYAIGYYSAFDPQTFITLPSETMVGGFYAVNTTYAALAIRDGDDIATAFEEGDWFKLLVEGFDANDASQGVVEYYLADYRSENAGDHYILDEWSWVDLASLGASVNRLAFTMNSSDVGDWGVNTPTYFAMDDFTVIPEPGTWLLALFGMGLIGLKRWRSRK